MDEVDEPVLESINYIQNNLFMYMDFLGRAFRQLTVTPCDETGIASNGKLLLCNRRYILNEFINDPDRLTRQYLHTVLHCIFQHQFVDESKDFRIWSLACDIAIENIISELDIEDIDRSCEAEQSKQINKLRESLDFMTAEKIYDYYMEHRLIDKRYNYLSECFKSDEHEIWLNIEDEEIENNNQNYDSDYTESDEHDNYNISNEDDQSDETEYEDNGRDAQSGTKENYGSKLNDKGQPDNELSVDIGTASNSANTIMI